MRISSSGWFCHFKLTPYVLSPKCREYLNHTHILLLSFSSMLKYSSTLPPHSLHIMWGWIEKRSGERAAEEGLRPRWEGGTRLKPLMGRRWKEHKQKPNNKAKCKTTIIKTHTCNNYHHNTPLYKSIKTRSRPFKEFTKRLLDFNNHWQKYIQTQLHKHTVLGLDIVWGILI